MKNYAPESACEGMPSNGFFCGSLGSCSYLVFNPEKAFEIGVPVKASIARQSQE
jgi:hypothetical protein